jgi:hypothetical protein
MNERRRFLKFAAAAAVPVVASAQENSGNQITGAWRTIHSLPFPPGSFREFLTFSTGGAVHETNSFLHTASNLDFSAFGLPRVLNASDGLGSWERTAQGQVKVVFHKMLFDGDRRNFGDLRATGTVTIRDGKLQADWMVEVVDLEGKLIAPLGPATSEGSRIE